MSIDITYHPISEIEMRKWYFSHNFKNIADGDAKSLEPIARQYGISQATFEKYLSILSSASKEDIRYANTDGFNLAIIQGFFKNYYYCADKSLTELIHNHSYLAEYTCQYRSVLLKDEVNEELIPHKSMIEECSSGLFIAADKVSLLLTDYEDIDIVREDINNYFQDYSKTFIRALNSAQYGNSGLLEANNIVCIEKGSVNTAQCASSAENCDVDSIRAHQILLRKNIKPIEKSKCNK